jgi:hypothetical protein
MNLCQLKNNYYPTQAAQQEPNNQGRGLMLEKLAAYLPSFIAVTK